MALLKVDRFRNVKAMLGYWPVTVWEFDPGSDLERKFKHLIGDTEEQTTRENVFQEDDPSGKRRYDKTVSIFSPTVASIILNFYAPNGGCCFDPFAGGGTRMAVAAAHGLRYVGIELREEECFALTEKAEKHGMQNVDILQGDSCNPETYKEHEIGNNWADVLMTCPPYWNLEEYNGGEADLSMLPSYEGFLEAIYPCIEKSYAILKKGAVSAWVVGLMRDSKGELLFMNHDIIRLHRKAGFKVKEEVVVYPKTGNSYTRSNMFLKGNKNLVRVHQYCLVFQKT